MEVDIFIAGIATIIAIVGFALFYIQRANMLRKLDSMTVEAEAHHQANYGMARHLRYLQLQNENFQVDSTGRKTGQDSEDQFEGKDRYFDSGPDVQDSTMTADIVDFRSANTHPTGADSGSTASHDGRLDSAVERLFSEGADARKLSEALGVSRSEAEIIAHIRPQNRNRV